MSPKGPYGLNHQCGVLWGGDTFRKIGLGATSLGHRRYTLERHRGTWAPPLSFSSWSWDRFYFMPPAQCAAPPHAQSNGANQSWTITPQTASWLILSLWCFLSVWSDTKTDLDYPGRKHFTLLKGYLLLNIQQMYLLLNVYYVQIKYVSRTLILWVLKHSLGQREANILENFLK